MPEEVLAAEDKKDSNNLIKIILIIIGILIVVGGVYFITRPENDYSKLSFGNVNSFELQEVFEIMK